MTATCIIVVFTCISTERRQRNIKSGLVPPPRPAFPKSTNKQSSSHIKPKSEYKRVETQSQSASGMAVAKKTDRQESTDSGAREVEKDRELWARLEELEREEEEYLSREGEEREREPAATHRNEEKEIAEGGDKPIIRTKFSEEKERVTVEIKEVSPNSKESVVAAGPLRITVKHTPSQDTAAPTRVKMVCTCTYWSFCQSCVCVNN